MPSARLLGKYGRLAGTDVTVSDEATIGRNEDNTVVVASRAASGKHARVVFDPAEEAFFLEDLGSLNGTRLDGVPILGRERLGRLHVISIAGRHELIYQGPELLAAAPGTEPASRRLNVPLEPPAAPPAPLPAPPATKRPKKAAPASRPERAPQPEAPERERTHVDDEAVPLPSALAEADETGDMGGAISETGLAPEHERTRVDLEALPLPGALAGGEATKPEHERTRVDLEALPLPTALGEPAEAAAAPRFYLVVTNYELPRRIELEEGENLVGRSPATRVQIDSPEISRRHAVLTVRGETVTVRDESSRNATFVGGVRLEGEMEVRPGATVRFGSIETQLLRMER